MPRTAVKQNRKIALRTLQNHFAVGIKPGLLQNSAAAIAHHNANTRCRLAIGIPALAGKGSVSIVMTVEQSTVRMDGRVRPRQKYRRAE